MCPAAERFHLLLLGRAECHLCEEFAEALIAEFGDRIALDRASVDERADWRLKFGRRIPVLLDRTGEPVCEGRFDREAVARMLA